MRVFVLSCEASISVLPKCPMTSLMLQWKSYKSGNACLNFLKMWLSLFKAANQKQEGKEMLPTASAVIINGTPPQNQTGTRSQSPRRVGFSSPAAQITTSVSPEKPQTSKTTRRRANVVPSVFTRLKERELRFCFAQTLIHFERRQRDEAFYFHFSSLCLLRTGRIDLILEAGVYALCAVYVSRTGSVSGDWFFILKYIFFKDLWNVSSRSLKDYIAFVLWQIGRFVAIPAPARRLRALAGRAGWLVVVESLLKNGFQRRLCFPECVEVKGRSILPFSSISPKRQLERKRVVKCSELLYCWKDFFFFFFFFECVNCIFTFCGDDSFWFVEINSLILFFWGGDAWCRVKSCF